MKEEDMNQNETANLIEILRCLNWKGDQINDLQLGIEGRVSIEETARRIKEGQNEDK